MPARVLVVCFMVVDDLVIVKARESVTVDIGPDILPRFPWKFGELDCFCSSVARSSAAPRGPARKPRPAVRRCFGEAASRPSERWGRPHRPRLPNRYGVASAPASEPLAPRKPSPLRVMDLIHTCLSDRLKVRIQPRKRTFSSTPGLPPGSQTPACRYISLSP